MQLLCCIKRMSSQKKKDLRFSHKSLVFMVGMRGFEPPASASRTLRSSQAEPHPVVKPESRPNAHPRQDFFQVVKLSVIA